MKKVFLTVIILASGLGLAACTHNQDQTTDHATMGKQASYQSGYSNKLGKLGRAKHNAS